MPSVVEWVTPLASLTFTVALPSCHTTEPTPPIRPRAATPAAACLSICIPSFVGLGSEPSGSRNRYLCAGRAIDGTLILCTAAPKETYDTVEPVVGSARTPLIPAESAVLT